MAAERTRRFLTVIEPICPLEKILYAFLAIGGVTASVALAPDLAEPGAQLPARPEKITVPAILPLVFRNSRRVDCLEFFFMLPSSRSLKSGFSDRGNNQGIKKCFLISDAASTAISLCPWPLGCTPSSRNKAVLTVSLSSVNSR